MVIVVPCVSRRDPGRMCRRRGPLSRRTGLARRNTATTRTTDIGSCDQQVRVSTSGSLFGEKCAENGKDRSKLSAKGVPVIRLTLALSLLAAGLVFAQQKGTPEKEEALKAEMVSHIDGMKDRKSTRLNSSHLGISYA